MGVSVYKLEVRGGRAARLYKLLADSKLTEFRVQQAIEKALDELMENPEFKQPDLGLEVAAEQVNKTSKRPKPYCKSRDHSHCPTCGYCEITDPCICYAR